MKYLFTLLFLLNVSVFYAQQTVHIDMDTVTIGTFDECYKILKDNCIIMMESEPNLEYNKLFDDFVDKSNYYEINGTYNGISLEGILEWTHDNISKTEFSDYAAAEASHQKMVDALKNCMRQNLDLHKYYQAAIKVHGSEILAKLGSELTQVYGNKFHF